MCRIIAIANQKGGVTKTTSALNLGIGLARHGKRVLLVDADAQSSLTASLGYAEPDSMEVALPAILAKIAQGENVLSGKLDGGSSSTLYGSDFCPAT